MTTQTTHQDQLKDNVMNHSNWKRLIFMVLFALLLQLASAVMWVLCALQFIFSIVTSQDNPNLRRLGNSIATFVHQALQYVSYNSSKKPFPFSDWPESSEPVDEVIEGDTEGSVERSGIESSQQKNEDELKNSSTDTQ